MKVKRKNVLIVVNYFYPYVSGVSEYARAVAKALASTHEVTVLTGRHLKTLSVVEQVDGYTIQRAAPLFFLNKGYVSIDFIHRFRLLSKKADVINLHFPMLESGLLSWLSDKPIILTYQCDMALVGNMISRLAVKTVMASGKIALRKASQVVVLSKDYAMSSSILEPYLNKVIEISPPNRFESHNLVGVQNKVAEGKAVKPFICGFVGRFVEEKGIGTILEAAERLQHEEIEFWLAGDYKNVAGGSVYKTFEDKITRLGNRVRLFGKLSDIELVEFYSKVDALMLPSTNRFEAFGMVQMEAMEFGAMVVTSDLPGVREVLLKTNMGELCLAGSSTSLADAINKIIVRRPWISREQVKNKLHEHFSLERFNNAYLSLIEKYLVTSVHKENI